MTIDDSLSLNQNRCHYPLITYLSYDEIEGAAFGIARLQSQYNLDPNKMFKEGIIETHLNLKHIKSEPSIRKFTSDDLFQIGKEGVNNGLENVGIHGMKCAIELAQNEFKMNETNEDYLNLWLEEEVPIDLPALEKHYKQTVERQSISCNHFCTYAHEHAQLCTPRIYICSRMLLASSCESQVCVFNLYSSSHAHVRMHNLKMYT